MRPWRHTLAQSFNSCIFSVRNNLYNMSAKKRTATTAAAKTDDTVAPSKKQSRLDNFVAKPATQTMLSALLTEPSWTKALQLEMNKAYFTKINEQLSKEYASGVQIFPPRNLIFNAFASTPLSEVKVVIIGQDPYHDDRQAHGLCFSVTPNVAIPPSLRNIYKELESDIPGFKAPTHGHLQCWARRGVFMLNATLTVQAHKANSHAQIGWQTFTDAVIRTISDERTGIVFVLWGEFAKKKAALIDAKKHAVIQTAHPSPLSANRFFGCKCFSKANDALTKFGKTPIDWSVEK